MFKFRAVVGGYEVSRRETGEVLGEIRRAVKFGYRYWRVSGTVNLFGTRVEAARYLLAKKEGLL